MVEIHFHFKDRGTEVIRAKSNPDKVTDEFVRAQSEKSFITIIDENYTRHLFPYGVWTDAIIEFFETKTKTHDTT